MLRGATAVNLDNKGRIAIPTRYRDFLRLDFDGHLVCTLDLHQPCLLLYPLPEWELIERKLAKLSTMIPEERRIQRLLLGHAQECQMDSAGRLLISQPLRQHAALTKQIMLVGQFNKFELWNEEAWHQQIRADINAEHTASEKLSERLRDLSL